MKNLIILLILFHVEFLSAKCAGEFFTAFPKTRTITPQSLILFEVTSFSKNIIFELNKKYPIYLQSKNQKIPLQIVETFKGTFRASQVLLKARQSLTVGEHYKLKIDNLSPRQKTLLKRWDSHAQSYKAFSWTVSKDTNIQPLKWTKEIRFKTFNSTAFGCGPADSALFSISSENPKQILMKAELWDIKSDKKVLYYLQQKEKEKLLVGHDMCSGAFSFIKPHSYKIRFQKLNISTQQKSKWSEWISFKTKPAFKVNVLP